MDSQLPPIHEAVRFWRPTEAATLAECITFRRTAPPGWNLSWLRNAADFIITRKLTESALRRAVLEHVIPDAQQSVMKALELLLAFTCKHNWTGQPLPPASYILPYGPEFKLQYVGRYYPTATNSEWILALQPRQGNVPNKEQFRIWRSALYYDVGDSIDNIMIVDLSKNAVNGKRELSEITDRKYPLIERSELDTRLDLIARCYARAVEAVPTRPEPPKRHHTDQPELPL